MTKRGFARDAFPKLASIADGNSAKHAPKPHVIANVRSKKEISGRRSTASLTHSSLFQGARGVGQCHRLSRVDVLCIDEMGYLNLRPEQTNIFFKLMEERYRQRATIITTNLAYEEWHNFLGNKALVDALLSRLRHQCHTVRIDGPTLRDPQG